MEEKEVIEKLLLKYNTLSDADKKILLIYNSLLGRLINQVINISNFEDMTARDIYKQMISREDFRNEYEKCKLIVLEPSNVVITETILSNIDFSNLFDFIYSLQEIAAKLLKINMVLDDDICVYRGINVKDIQGISKNTLFSTSISNQDAQKYMLGSNSKHLFKINLKKDTSIFFSPESIVLKYPVGFDALSCKFNGIEPTVLEVKNNKTNNLEIILNRNDIDYLSINNSVISLTNGSILIHEVMTSPRLKTDSNRKNR